MNLFHLCDIAELSALEHKQFKQLLDIPIIQKLIAQDKFHARGLTKYASNKSEKFQKVINQKILIQDKY